MTNHWATDSVLFRRNKILGVGQGNEEADEDLAYSLDDALDGLFITHDKFGAIVERLRAKKNVILQGPPGVVRRFSHAE